MDLLGKVRLPKFGQTWRIPRWPLTPYRKPTIL